MSVLIQRPLRGSRISSFYPVKNLPSLASLDSAFQLQEYISLLIRLDVHDVDTIVSLPGKANGKTKGKESDKNKDLDADGTDAVEEQAADDKDADKGKSEVTVDEACWIYEQLRRLAQDLSHPLITMLQQECTRLSCPEMKAGEWLYLCVAHGTDGAMEQCCAIDYILHTVDSATALLNSPRAFPSRLQIPQTSHRHFSSLARRLGRIFAHAYFHHRETFEQAEVESSLYARFLALTSKFDLVPPEFLVIPQRLAHHDGEETSRSMEVQPPRLLAAAVDPQGQSGGPQDRMKEDPSLDPLQWDRRGSIVGPAAGVERAKSHSPPGLGSGSESPRKIGRNRTDTMVFSEAYAVAEDLAKADEQEKDRESEVAKSTESSLNAPALELNATSLVPPWASEDSTSPASPPGTAKPSLPETQSPPEPPQESSLQAEHLVPPETTLAQNVPDLLTTPEIEVDLSSALESTPSIVEHNVIPVTDPQASTEIPDVPVIITASEPEPSETVETPSYPEPSSEAAIMTPSPTDEEVVPEAIADIPQDIRVEEALAPLEVPAFDDKADTVEGTIEDKVPDVQEPPPPIADEIPDIAPTADPLPSDDEGEKKETAPHTSIDPDPETIALAVTAELPASSSKSEKETDGTDVGETQEGIEDTVTGGEDESADMTVSVGEGNAASEPEAKPLA